MTQSPNLIPAAAALALSALLAAPASAQPRPAADMAALQARSIAATCANCHGTNGRAVGEMKTLAGEPAEKTLAKLADFKSGAQPATIMHQIVKGYTDEQLQMAAKYFAVQPAKP